MSIARSQVIRRVGGYYGSSGGGISGDDMTITSSTISGNSGDGIISNWEDDTLMLANGLWGHHLLSDSPAIDAGNNALAVDPDGIPLTSDQAGHPCMTGQTAN